MKCSLVGVVATVFFISCKKNVTNYTLSKAQTQFIDSIVVGDTAIWKNSAGLKDTGVVNPLISQTYLLTNGSSDVTYGQRTYYLYRFIGKKKTNIGYGVEVVSESNHPAFLGTACFMGSTLSPFVNATGMYASKTLGGVLYNDVYWSAGPAGIADTVYWNAQGCIGTLFNGDTVLRIR
jgi:hypothetical protein